MMSLWATDYCKYLQRKAKQSKFHLLNDIHSQSSLDKTYKAMEEEDQKNPEKHQKEIFMFEFPWKHT